MLKPPPETPLDPYLLGEAILEADLPPGVIDIVAAGRELGPEGIAPYTGYRTIILPPRASLRGRSEEPP